MARHGLILVLLKLLEEESDEEHILTMTEIQERLQRIDPSVKIERRTVYSLIDQLIDLGYDISTYSKKEGSFDGNRKGYFLRERVFENAELKFIVDGIATSKSIPNKQRIQLIEKVMALGSKSFQKNKPMFLFDLNHQVVNPELFINIDVLANAIRDKKQVSFVTCNFNIDKKLVPNYNGKRFVVNPYHLVVHNQKYYLVCNYQARENLTNVRLDRMMSVNIENSNLKPFNDNMYNYLEQRPFMYSDDLINAEILIKKNIIGDVLETFGNGIVLYDHDAKNAKIKIKVSRQALIYWAIQYGANCEVIWPENLRSQIREAIINILDKYKT